MNKRLAYTLLLSLPWVGTAGLYAVHALAEAPASGPSSQPSASERSVLKEEDIVVDADKASNAAGSVSRMKDVLQRLLELREEARDSKDVVKLNCVNDKLTQVTGLLKMGEAAEVLLKDSLARRDHEAALHEFTKVTLGRQKTEDLRTEAESCVGELAVYSGSTQVTVETKTQRKGDPTQTPSTQLPPDRAVPASPYQ